MSLQRLFSTFPNNWPGVGLLLLRSCLGITLIYFAISDLAAKSSEPATLAQDSLAATGGGFLILGLWTPLMGGLVVLEEAWRLFSLHCRHDESALIHLLLAVIAVSVAMLGPGAWSIDARLFGRKHFVIDRTKKSKTSP